MIHLASTFGPALDDEELPAGGDVTIARRVLDAAAAGEVRTVVAARRAPPSMAHGPTILSRLTEDAPLRPNSELAFAVEKAEVERLAGEWRDERPEATVALLRAAPAVSEDAIGWITRALDAIDGLPTADSDPPSQYLHLDDLAAAVDVARRKRLDGPVNVAPDGWLEAADRRARSGAAPASAGACGGEGRDLAVAVGVGAHSAGGPALCPSCMGRGQRPPPRRRMDAASQQ